MKPTHTCKEYPNIMGWFSGDFVTKCKMCRLPYFPTILKKKNKRMLECFLLNMKVFWVFFFSIMVSVTATSFMPWRTRTSQSIDHYVPEQSLHSPLWPLSILMTAPIMPPPPPPPPPQAGKHFMFACLMQCHAVNGCSTHFCCAVWPLQTWHVLPKVSQSPPCV